MADVNYFNPAGEAVSASDWIGERANAFGVSYSHGDAETLTVSAWYSGVKHGENGRGRPLIFEVAVNGDPNDRSHDGYHRYHATLIDQASCQADFDRVKAAIIRGDVL